MSITPPKEHPWRRTAPLVKLEPLTDVVDKNRARRKIMNDAERRDQASRKHELALAGRVGNGGRNT